MAEPRINAITVRRLARTGRVVAHPSKYHAGKHGIGLQGCINALEHCHQVQPDPRHEGSWFATARRPYGRRLRVDFDVFEDEGGTLVLVVTAYHL